MKNKLSPLVQQNLVEQFEAKYQLRGIMGLEQPRRSQTIQNEINKLRSELQTQGEREKMLKLKIAHLQSRNQELLKLFTNLESQQLSENSTCSVNQTSKTSGTPKSRQSLSVKSRPSKNFDSYF